MALEADQAQASRFRNRPRLAFFTAPPLVPSQSEGVCPRRSRQGQADPAPQHPQIPRCPEIDCVRYALPPWTIDMAELRAAEIGVGADRVLIAEGHISEEAYVAALAAALGAVFETFDGTSRDSCPLPNDGLIDAATTGLLHLTVAGELTLVIAPCMVESRRLMEAVASSPDFGRRLRVTTVARLQGYVRREAIGEIEYRAVEALRAARPELSAAAAAFRPVRRGHVIATLAVAALVTLAAPRLVLATTEFVLGMVFLAWTGLRLFSTMNWGLTPPRRHTPPDDRLPIYSLIVALYHEAAAVNDLITALQALDYPALGSKHTLIQGEA